MREFTRFVLSCERLHTGNVGIVHPTDDRARCAVSDLSEQMQQAIGPKYDGDAPLDLLVAFAGDAPHKCLCMVARTGIVLGEGVGPIVPGWSVESICTPTSRFYRMKRQ